MKLYIMRHSLAAKLMEAKVATDEERPLTLEGESRAKTVGMALQKLGIIPEVIWTSPLVRARQTAAIVSAQLQRTDAVEEKDVLKPEMTPESFIAELQLETASSLMIVGHQPDLGELICYLLWGRVAQMRLEEASVVGLDLPSSLSSAKARLEFLLSPDIADRMMIQ